VRSCAAATCTSSSMGGKAGWEGTTRSGAGVPRARTRSRKVPARARSPNRAAPHRKHHDKRESPMQVQAVGQVVLKVQRLERSEHFYAGLLVLRSVPACRSQSA
jgi:hypothetical protein